MAIEYPFTIVQIYNKEIIGERWYQMKRRILNLVVIALLLLFILVILSRYIVPAILSNFIPSPTNIFSGPVDSELLNQLRATQSYGEISKDQAIGLAELYCASVHSPSQKNPTNIKAYHLTEAEAMLLLYSGQLSTSLTPVWLVMMDGSWEHEGPVQQTDTPLLIFTHCKVIINAQTSDLMVVTN